MGSIAAPRLAGLVGDFDRSRRTPGWPTAATPDRRRPGRGRPATAQRARPERRPRVSRTTVTRAYAALVESGFAVARQGSGTYTRLPGGRRRPRPHPDPPRDRDDVIDLNCAAPPRRPARYGLRRGRADLPLYLGGHGYFPTGLPALQAAVAASYDARGLPTDPEQIMVVPGALSALTIVAQGLVRPRDRALVESPGYPNAHEALRRAGARRVAGAHGRRRLGPRRGRPVANRRPRLAYLIPDFQNPTGNLMDDAQREQYAALLRRTGTVPIVDESHQPLGLDGGRCLGPSPRSRPRR